MSTGESGKNMPNGTHEQLGLNRNGFVEVSSERVAAYRRGINLLRSADMFIPERRREADVVKVHICQYLASALT